jgi:phenol hydroxylase P0 protein
MHDIKGSHFDPELRYIRIVQRRADGLVAFEFAVGEPQLFVEMLMPQAQFEAFCAQQAVEPTEGALPEEPQDSEAHEWAWTLQAAREQRFRTG